MSAPPHLAPTPGTRALRPTRPTSAGLRARLALAGLAAAIFTACTGPRPPPSQEPAPPPPQAQEPAQPPPPAQEPAAPPEPSRATGGLGSALLDPRTTEARFLAACTRACERAQARRAVGAELIRAECEEGCSAEWRLPLATRGADLPKPDGARVRVSGRIDLGAHATTSPRRATILLDDGTHLVAHLRELDLPDPALDVVSVVASGALFAGEPLRLDDVIAVGRMD